MGVIIGRKGKIATSTDGVAYIDLGKVLSGDLSTTSDIADSTTNDSDGWKGGEYADAQAALSVAMKFDSSNAGQKALIDELTTNRAKIYFRVRPEETTGELQWIFMATMSEDTVSFATGEVQEMNISAESSGVVSVSAQP